MKHASPLVHGRLVKRYKRFLADVTLDSGEVVTASCPNTGSMMGLSAPGMGVWLSQNESATRKYRHTLELVEVADGIETTCVGINTGLPNKIVMEAIELERIPDLAGYATRKAEVKYGQNSRIDILLEDPAKGRCYVEIKNVHLVRQRLLAEFPDSVTSRGAKHLDELADMVAAGHRAVMVYLIQRDDVEAFALAADLDPNYAAAFSRATAAGVEAVACRCRVTPAEITLDQLLPLQKTKR
jgi:sugar fermentation stimulation protein A